MSTPILATKLYVPGVRPKFIPRPHLLARLNDGLHRKLTLISAPAGFGKTSIVSEWAASLADVTSVAWLSLDDGDNDPTRFLAYLIAALQTISAEIGTQSLTELQSPQPPPTESILTLLINDISTQPEQFVFVLDDYHLLDSKQVDGALTFLLEHLPPQMHLVIATREDPPLPLARLRVRSELTELRVADLRFTLDESAEFLNQTMGLSLTPEDIATLENGTEGWIAGLQLAALSMQGRSDTSAFIEAFTGSHHFILDYLIEEVLQQQPENVRTFLLQTSILNKLNGSLCDAVTDSANSKAMLEQLERDNLFVIPLDNDRQWYRYHHLFADVLQARAMEDHPETVDGRHKKASAWFDANDQRADAVRHALLAKDFERVANLIELSWRYMDRNYMNATSLMWLVQLPEEVIAPRPVISIAYAWALLAEGRLEEAELYIQQAEKWAARLEEGDSAEMRAAEQKEVDALPSSVASARTYLALADGNMPDTIKYARQTLDLLPEEDLFERSIPAALLGLALWTTGDLEATYKAFADIAVSFEKSGNPHHSVGTGFIAALVRRTQGRLHDAYACLQKSLSFAADLGEVVPGLADLHIGLSELFLEWGDLDSAEKHLQTAADLSPATLLPGNQHFWYLAAARIKESRGELDEAISLLDEAIRLQKRDPIPDVRPIAARKVPILLKQNRLAEAQTWVREQNLSADDDLVYLREYEHMVLARVLIANQKFEDAGSLLARLEEAALAGERIGSAIEINILQSLAQQESNAALDALSRALKHAEPQGYISTFVDEGEAMASLLAKLNTRNSVPSAYINKLLHHFTGSPPSQPTAPTPQPLHDPLSQRELEVLQLIADGLSNREISERLFLALDTIKGHNRRIYSKLQVQRRTEAVARARKLGLVQAASQ